MDFSNRNSQPQNVAPGAHSPATGTSRKQTSSDNNFAKIGFISLIAAVVILLLGVLAFISLGGNAKADEQKYVDNSRLQAVFLSTGQVYFGNVSELNSRYFVLKNIYYLQTANTGTAAAANTSVSLVKLGCELHSPYDQMLINRTQVTFWENLQDNGQVAKAVKKFKTDNPKGQKCTDQSNTGSTGSTTVQGSAGSTAPTTSTPATTKP